MLRVVCWLWPAKPGYRAQFDHNHVNTFRSMVERCYPDPHEVVCITNVPKGIDPRVRIVPLWEDFADLPSPYGELQPACWRRLRAFSTEMVDVIGPRFVSVDLDVVMVGDMRPLWNRPEDFVIWNSPLRGTPYNGTMWMMTAGARRQVYEDFDPRISPGIVKRHGYRGSDQAWFSYKLGPDQPVWTNKDGVYAWRSDLKRRGYALPDGARLVSFHGLTKPWDEHARRVAPWVEEHYR